MLKRAFVTAGSLLSLRFWCFKFAMWQAARFALPYQTDILAQLPAVALREVPAGLREQALRFKASALPKIERALRIVRAQLGVFECARDFQMVLGNGAMRFFRLADDLSTSQAIMKPATGDAI